MNKSELISAISKETGMSVKATTTFINGFQNVVTKALCDNEKVFLWQIGVLVPAVREERKGRNPQNGEQITIPKSIAVKFKLSDALKRRLNNG